MSTKPILYYVPGSPPCRAVLLVAKALGVELDLKLIDMPAGEHRQPWFLEINPQHTLPTLVDDGRSLWDSHAICTYLIGKYGGGDHPLYPADLYTRARIDQRLYFDTSVLFGVAKSIIYGIFFAGKTGPSEEQVNATHEAYALLESFLVGQNYAVGAELTVADLSLVVSVTQLATQVPLGAGKYPAIEAWLGRLEQLPYFDELNTQLVKGFVTLINGVIERNKGAAK